MSKTILITGSSSGIGKATAQHFQAQGWNVVATMRTPENETELAGLDNVLVTRLDVLDEDSIRTAVAATLERFGRIDVLLNNAGYGAYGPLEAFSMEGVRRQFETNVVGLIGVTKAVLPHMRAQRSGQILNVSSVGGQVTFPLGSLYHGTKFAVEGISEALHFELAPLGIRVKIIEPGAIHTDFAGRSFDFTNDESLTEYQPLVNTMLAGIEGELMANASQPSEVAEIIERCVHDDGGQLRFPAAGGAEQFLAARQASGDQGWCAQIRQQFGIA